MVSAKGFPSAPDGARCQTGDQKRYDALTRFRTCLRAAGLSDVRAVLDTRHSDGLAVDANQRLLGCYDGKHTILGPSDNNIAIFQLYFYTGRSYRTKWTVI